MRRVLALGLATLLLAVGCSPFDQSTATSGVAISDLETPSPSLSERDLVQAIQFRKTFGLRSDEAWIRSVASDAAAQESIEDLGVPLTPLERQELLGRRPVDEDAAAAAERYGRAFPESFGGVFVDQRAGGVLVAAFTEDIDRHERALAALVPGQPPEVRLVKWSLAELELFRTQVEADRAWFATIGAKLSKADVDVLENAVRVVFMGPSEEMTSLVDKHLGTWSESNWLGPLPWDGPVGDLVLIVVDERGKPVPQVWCDLISADPRVQVAEGPPIGSDAAGRCTFADYAAVAYKVALKEFTGTGYRLVREVRATLVPTGTVVEVVVPTR